MTTRPRRDFIRDCALTAAAGALLPRRTWGAQEQASLHEALYWEQAADGATRCTLCPAACVRTPGTDGSCRARGNRDGSLYSLVYGRPAVISLDRIEKSPLYHFEIEGKAFSIATAGCNLHCRFCQNWPYSQEGPDAVKSYNLSPRDVIARAKKHKVNTINFFYTEPVVYYEYMIDIAQRAKKEGMQTVCVTAGFINPEPLLQLTELIDAFVFGLKGFDDTFYRTYIGCELEPIKRALKILSEKRDTTWVEVVNLLVPGLNDSDASVRAMCAWLASDIGVDVPLHFTRFEPYYELKKVPPTPVETIRKAHAAAGAAGLQYVYMGNIPGSEGANTFCPKCGKAVVERVNFQVVKRHLKKGVCTCGFRLPGQWL